MCMNMLLVTFAILQHSDARHDNHYDDEMGGIYISIGWVMAIAILVAFFTLPINRHSGVLRMLHLVILLVASAGVAGVVRSRIVVLNVMDARELLTIADICNDTMIRCIV